MHLYSISCGNPEGTDFELLFQHEKVFTKEEFQEISEEAFCYALEKQHNETGFASADCSEEEIIEFFKAKGFVDPPPITAYYLERYWSRDRIKSQKLKELLDKPDDIEKYEKYVESQEKNEASNTNNNK